MSDVKTQRHGTLIGHDELGTKMTMIPVDGTALNSLSMVNAVVSAMEERDTKSRARSLAITKLQEAGFWLSKAVGEEAE